MGHWANFKWVIREVFTDKMTFFVCSNIKELEEYVIRLSGGKACAKLLGRSIRISSGAQG